jgi:hypothetical protein
VTVAGLTIENGLSLVHLHGAAEFGADEASLSTLRRLIGELKALEAAIMAAPGSERPTAAAEEPAPLEFVDNPF